jgi:hypothetical protein
VIGTNSEVARSDDSWRRDRGLVIAALLCIGAGCYVLLMAVWDVLPEWFPMMGGHGVTVCQCWCFLGSCGLYLWFAFAVMLWALGRVLGRFLKGEFRGAFVPIIVLLLVSCFVLALFMGTGKIERALLDYGIRRYDKVIKAIEQYKADNGAYPESLDVLVPAYFSSKPGIFLKYGERLNYAPITRKDDGAPFRFELYGHDASGIHGRILKYCPVAFDCPNGDRINDRWMWTFSSAL